MKKGMAVAILSVIATGLSGWAGVQIIENKSKIAKLNGEEQLSYRTLENKLSNVLTALCMIDEKTCHLKDLK